MQIYSRVLYSVIIFSINLIISILSNRVPKELSHLFYALVILYDRWSGFQDNYLFRKIFDDLIRVFVNAESVVPV